MKWFRENNFLFIHTTLKCVKYLLINVITIFEIQKRTHTTKNPMRMRNNNAIDAGHLSTGKGRPSSVTNFSCLLVYC